MAAATDNAAAASRTVTVSGGGYGDSHLDRAVGRGAGRRGGAVRRWELVGDGSAKFWEAEAEGATVTVRYGRVGAQGRTQPKELGSAEAAEAYLAKGIAEKEGKGYREVEVAADPEPAVLPDEDTFVMPAAWRRLVHPRRGGIPRTVPELRADAQELLDGRLKEEAGWIEQMLAAPESDPRIVDAVRAHLKGSQSPLGAAALASLTMHYQLPDGVFVDAWVRAHGLAFAARAVVEYFDIETHWMQHGGHRQDPRIGFRAGTTTGSGHWGGPFASRLRALLAVADEDIFQETVAVLAECRDSVRRRVVVAYVVPSEHDWVADACTDADKIDTGLRSLLLCSLNSPEQLATVGTSLHLGWNDWTMPMVASLAEGIGPHIAPVLERGIETAYGSDRVRAFSATLVELPTDEAFGVLLARVEDKNVRPYLMEAMRRRPVRALRLLGAAATGTAKYASTVEQLLVAHIQTHAELTAAVLPELPARVAEFIEPRLAFRDRVAEASAEALPALLVSPPWAKQRKAAKARVAAKAPVAPEPKVVWRPDEQKAWAGVSSWYSTWRGKYEWKEEIKTLQNGGQLSDVRQARLFVTAPEDVVRPLLAHCAPEDYWDGEAALKPVAARFGVDALPLMLRAATRHPATLSMLVMPYLSVEVAGLVSDWLARLKSADALARAWLKRHGLATVPCLLPHAVGKAGHARRGAERALRLLVEAHGREAVLAAVAESGQAAAGIVSEALDADPLESALPTRMPTVGAWAEPALLPQIVLKEGGAALPADAVRNALMVLALSKPGDVYPGLDVLTEHCTADSLAAFAWGLFEQWRLAGMPAKESWALHALGWLGDDEVVRRLTPVVRAWPGESAHHRAVEGLNVLATIGSDVALLHLHGIAQRVPFKALKTRAQEKIAEVAEGLGLTGEQLGDRLVPDFGLNADGSTVIDYGPRQFTVGFDEQLRPYVRDADGKHRKALPTPAAKDDPELAPAERKRFAALKKDARTVATDQVRRLEAAMVAQRSWTAGEFRDLFVAHPLLWHLVRRLVWLSETDGEVTAFRVAEDRTFADVEDDELTLPEGASIRLAHPLNLGGELGAWSELFADYEILQPFPQLGRAVHALTEEEAAEHRLARFEGATVPVGKLLGLTKRGWERGEPQDAGVERWFFRRIDEGRYLVIDLDPGIAVGAVDMLGDQTFNAVWLNTTPDDYWRNRKNDLSFAGLDPVIASELLADLTEVTAK
ncbi:DUF4132 domain-containing protein [Streptomyces sp. NBC_00287]|uniref:DUF4132 domain-containing protein n=1 Tax=Streptomyces sp. NBC_00287 TaxID=2975702 RepID=UPI002E29BBB2|nr:DUF4132 domain-containing protein [Streptomyces sp. NBC_00287]